MRVVHVDTGETWRGGQRQVLLLARGLADAGTTSMVACAPGGRLCTRAEAAGLPTFPVKAASDIDVRAALLLRRVVTSQRADVVHAHDARAHAISLLALVGMRTPLVVTRRVVFAPKGRVKYGPRVARFIAISRAVRDSLAAAGVPLERISVVNSGVPDPGSAQAIDWRTRAGFPSHTVICGVVGAMTAEKGIGSLAAIAARLPREVARRIALVLIGGSGPERSDVIGELAAFHAGFVDDIAGAAAGLDLLWHPSTAEGLGTALLDAMLQGVPPVAYATGGIPEIVEDGVSGLLVQPGQTQSFAAAVARLASDPSLRATLGAGARTRAREFSADRMIAGTLAVYQRVLSGGS